MEVEVKEIESIPIIYIIGEITLYDVELINRAVANVRQSGKNSIIVNMRDVTFMDSSGIGVFMRTIVTLSKERGFLYFASCTKRIRTLLDFSLENTLSKILDTEEEAVIELKKELKNL